MFFSLFFSFHYSGFILKHFCHNILSFKNILVSTFFHQWMCWWNLYSVSGHTFSSAQCSCHSENFSLKTCNLRSLLFPNIYSMPVSFVCLSVSLCLSVSFFLSLTHIHAFSLPHTPTQTHKHTHIHTHIHTGGHSSDCADVLIGQHQAHQPAHSYDGQVHVTKP